jgi:hypothetical protein
LLLGTCPGDCDNKENGYDGCAVRKTSHPRIYPFAAMREASPLKAWSLTGCTPLAEIHRL